MIFFINKLDPNVIELDFEADELLSIINKIGCPIHVGKGIFKSLGIPSNWNLLLGVLSWFCDLVKDK